MNDSLYDCSQYQEKTQPPPEDPSNDRANINRNNAQRSSGPKSIEGKRIASLNAVKTALTGRTVLLAGDDVELYKQHVDGWFAELKPEGLQETTLVQSIADSHWRNDRIVSIEAAIFARGRVVHCYENDNLYGDELGNPADLKLLVDAQVNTLYERQLRNLHIQENRLRRQRERDMADLEALQQERRERSKRENPPVVAASLPPHRKDGFVFSTSENSQIPRDKTAPNKEGDRRKLRNSGRSARKGSRR